VTALRDLWRRIWGHRPPAPDPDIEAARERTDNYETRVRWHTDRMVRNADQINARVHETNHISEAVAALLGRRTP
jgi:hypothetical protein